MSNKNGNGYDKIIEVKEVIKNFKVGDGEVTILKVSHLMSNRVNCLMSDLQVTASQPADYDYRHDRPPMVSIVTGRSP
jgi:hypothetical protein